MSKTGKRTEEKRDERFPKVRQNSLNKYLHGPRCFDMPMCVLLLRAVNTRITKDFKVQNFKEPWTKQAVLGFEDQEKQTLAHTL